MNYIKKTLKNGVKLYLYLDKNMKSSFVSYMVNYGNLGCWYDFYLDNKLYHVSPGCAHYLEHLLCEHSKYGHVYNKFTNKGYFANAATGEKITYYYFRGKKDILNSIEMLINIVDNPVFTEEDVEQTRHAIIEETKLTKNNITSSILSLLNKNIFKGMNLCDETLSFIGDEKTTNDINYDMLKLCYDAFYYDKNKTLLIAGNYDEKEITQHIENIYSKLKPHKKRVKEYNYTDLDKIKIKKQIIHMPTKDDILGIAFKETNTNFTKNEIRYYMNFLNDSIFSEKSIFIQHLKKANLLVNIKFLHLFFLNEKTYIIYVSACVKNSVKMKSKIINKLKNAKFNKKEFDLFIRKNISNEALNEDYKYDHFKSFAHQKEYDDNFSNLNFVNQLSFERFLEFYHSLDFNNYTVGIISEK